MSELKIYIVQPLRMPKSSWHAECIVSIVESEATMERQDKLTELDKRILENHELINALIEMQSEEFEEYREAHIADLQYKSMQLTVEYDKLNNA